MTKNQEALAERREMKQDSFVPSVTADAAPRESANAGAASRYVAPPIWPNGCIKPGSCSKDTSRRCMYARTREQCPHVDRDIGPEIDAERTRRDRVSDGSPQGQDAKRLDPKDESAAVPAETPHSLPPKAGGIGELVEELRRPQALHALTGKPVYNKTFIRAAAAIETQAAEIERLKQVALESQAGRERICVLYDEQRIRAETAEARIAELEEGRDGDYFGSLVARARAAAAKAAIKFPQPNYVTLKIAEEAGEVVRGAVHYAENRMSWEEVEGEIVQLLAMLIRFVVEGDEINGVRPPRAPLTTPPSQGERERPERMLRGERQMPEMLQSALAQIREAYRALCRGPVADQKQLAEGLIAPAIRRLEATADLLQSLQVRAEAAESQCAVLTREVAIHKGNADDIYAKWAEERDRRVGAESRLAEAVKVIEEITPLLVASKLKDVAAYHRARAFLSTGGDNG